MKNLCRFLVYPLILFLIIIPTQTWAFWVWTPETNKWVNPKYAVKETPAEQLQYGLDFYKTKDYKAAIREWEKLVRHYPLAREAPDAQYYIAKCWEDQGKLYQAFKQYQVVIEKYPFSERSGEIVKRQFEIGIKLLEGEAKENKFVDTLKGGNYYVVDVFKAVIKNAPYGEYAAPAQYKIGLYLLEKKLYQEARDEFEKVINDYPTSEWAKAAKYQIGISDAKRSTDAAYDQKVTQAAVTEFKEFVEHNPDAELTAKAKKQIRELREKEAENSFLIAQFYEKQKNYSAAKIYYQKIVDEYSDSKWAPRSLEKIREMSRKEQR